MNTQNQPATSLATLIDLDIVTPELAERISASASSGSLSIRETYIVRYSHSRAEAAAACELAESVGLVVL